MILLGDPPRHLTVVSELTSWAQSAMLRMPCCNAVFNHQFHHKKEIRGTQRSMDMFHSTCAAGAHQPVRATTVQMPLGFRFSFGGRRFAASISNRHGVIVAFPIPVGAIITAPARSRRHDSGQVEIVAILSRPESVNGFPLLSYYPFPMKAFESRNRDSRPFFEAGALRRSNNSIGNSWRRRRKKSRRENRQLLSSAFDQAVVATRSVESSKQAETWMGSFLERLMHLAWARGESAMAMPPAFNGISEIHSHGAQAVSVSRKIFHFAWGLRKAPLIFNRDGFLFKSPSEASIIAPREISPKSLWRMRVTSAM